MFRLKFTFALLALSMAMPTMMASALPDVYPTPQKAEFTGRYVKAGQVRLIDGTREPNAPELKDLPQTEGAYRLTIREGLVTVAAREKLGFFYAKQTLSQLIKDTQSGLYAQKDPFPDKDLKAVAAMGELAECDIKDWPDIMNRGTVEGFYGMYWTHEARKKQLEFYGRNKMNTYIYAPKDDPYHSHHWREFYPDKEATQIRELVEIAKRNHVNFVWALHPGFNIRWTDEDRANVLKKLEAMYDLGVRSFGLFFDDVGGDAANIDRQIELVNLIYKEFIHKKGDIPPLIFCPSGYNRSWTRADQLQHLGKMEPTVRIMWTGNSVVSDITTEGQEWVTKNLGRPVYIWWNFPVTDYCHDRLLMGRVYGLTQDDQAMGSMTGFVSNPMDRPEASKIGIFGVGNYGWNIKGYQSDKTWKDGIKRLYPEVSEAMQTFANHNSDIGISGHGLRREESVAIAPEVEKLKAALKAGDRQNWTSSLVYKEYEKITKAAQILLNDKTNPELVAEIQPWLRAFEKLGIAGSCSIKALQNNSINDLAQSVSAFDEMARIPEDYKTIAGGKFLRKGVTTGGSVMMPLTRDLIQKAADHLYSQLSGKTTIRGSFLVNGGNLDPEGKATDGRSDTFWHSGAYQKAGDWYCLDFGDSVPVRNIMLTMGRHDKDSDFVARGQLEVSRDMEIWIPLGGETTSMRVFWQSNKPIYARAIRYRIIEPNYINPDKKGNTVWTAIRDFAVNCPVPAFASSTVQGLAGLSVQEKSNLVGINTVMEVKTMKKGDSIKLVLPEPVDATWAEVNLDNSSLPEWAEVSVETTGSSKPVVLKLSPYKNKAFIAKGADLPKGIKSLTLKHNGNNPQDIKLNMFKLDVPPKDSAHRASSLIDGNLVSVYRADRPFDVTIQNTDVPEANQVVIVGTADFSFRIQKKDGSWSETMKSSSNGAVTVCSPGPSIRAIRLISEKTQSGQSIHEVIFKK